MTDAAEPADGSDPRRPGGKGRPTPKRRDGTARRGPVAPPPTTRREAAKRVREQGKQQRTNVRSSAKAGDDRYQLKRDQGPVRGLIRDLVDSRRHLSVLLLPAALLPLLGQLTRVQAIVQLATVLWLATLIAAMSDFASTALLVRKRVKADFPEDKGRGHLFYATLRTAQFRRFRIPKPRVQVGEQV